MSVHHWNHLEFDVDGGYVSITDHSNRTFLCDVPVEALYDCVMNHFGPDELAHVPAPRPTLTEVLQMALRSPRAPE